MTEQTKTLIGWQEGDESFDFYSDGTIEVHTEPQNLGCCGFYGLDADKTKQLYGRMVNFFEPDLRAYRWISVDKVQLLPDFDQPVIVYAKEDWLNNDAVREVPARRVKTNDAGDWGWYSLDLHNTMLQNVTHFRRPMPPGGSND